VLLVRQVFGTILVMLQMLVSKLQVYSFNTFMKHG
jgi:hypothetical protein